MGCEFNGNFSPYSQRFGNTTYTLGKNFVHVLEAFMDYTNPVATSFRGLGALENTIACFKSAILRRKDTEWRITIRFQGKVSSEQ